MRALLQRVTEASVSVEGKRVAQINSGLLVFLGIAPDDNLGKAQKLANRTLSYRIFLDPEGRMNCSLKEIKGELLVISQFTLCADTAKGLRPGFSTAASPELAERLYEDFVQCCRPHIDRVETGIFGANMQVSLINDGPVTFVLDS